MFRSFSEEGLMVQAQTVRPCGDGSAPASTGKEAAKSKAVSLPDSPRATNIIRP